MCPFLYGKTGENCDIMTAVTVFAEIMWLIGAFFRFIPLMYIFYKLARNWYIISRGLLSNKTIFIVVACFLVNSLGEVIWKIVGALYLSGMVSYRVYRGDVSNMFAVIQVFYLLGNSLYPSFWYDSVNRTNKPLGHCQDNRSTKIHLAIGVVLSTGIWLWIFLGISNYISVIYLSLYSLLLFDYLLAKRIIIKALTLQSTHNPQTNASELKLKLELYIRIVNRIISVILVNILVTALNIVSAFGVSNIYFRLTIVTVYKLSEALLILAVCRDTFERYKQRVIETINVTQGEITSEQQ